MTLMIWWWSRKRCFKNMVKRIWIKLRRMSLPWWEEGSLTRMPPRTSKVISMTHLCWTKPSRTELKFSRQQMRLLSSRAHISKMSCLTETFEMTSSLQVASQISTELQTKTTWTDLTTQFERTRTFEPRVAAIGVATLTPRAWWTSQWTRTTWAVSMI